MNRTFIFTVSLILACAMVSLAVTMPEPMRLSRARAQDELIDAVQVVALIHQFRPVMDLLQARRYLINQVLDTNTPMREARMLRAEYLEHFMVKAPMSWELLSMVPEARLYALFTAADLGGYGDNEPPYEPSNPFPANGATDVSRTVTLQWTGGDPNPEDTVYYDLYFGTSSPPPLMASSLTMESYEVTDLDPGTMYYWQIIARDNWDATTEGQIWQFTTLPNDPPFEPVNPIPPDGGTDIDTNANLSWQCNDPNPGDTLVFDVYFGTVDPPPMVASDLAELTYDPGALEQGTMYYWYIVARDNWGAETTGPTWSFTTLVGTNNPPYEPTNPMPSNGATGVDVNADLSWEGGDPDPGDTVVYDVYFGTDPSPAVVAQNLTDTTYDPGTLEEGRMYYWYIVARDSHSAETTGPVWNFVTFSSTTPTPTPPVGTPTPTPTGNPCVEWSVELDMGLEYFCPGDICYLDAIVCNPEAAVYNPLWIILEVEGMFWFAPSWSEEVDYYMEQPIPNGWSTWEILPAFTWPNVEGQYMGARFWGAITTTEYQILGQYDMYEFGWGPCM